MRTAIYANKRYTLDGNGFLDPADQWDEDFAQGMARELGIRDGLTDEHWKIVRYVRGQYVNERSVPLLVMACAASGMRLNDLRRLFPTGYHRGACRIAGINYSFLSQDNLWHTYETAPLPKPRFPLDALGFLKEFENWEEDFAPAAAQTLGWDQELDEMHWRVIRYLREAYAAQGTIPTIYETCMANGLELRSLRVLFPAGYRRGACLLAGLPFEG